MSVERETTRPRTRRSVRVGLAVLFALVLGWDVWEGLGNLLGVTGTATALGTSVSAVGWVVLVGLILLPVAAFVTAVVAARRLPLLPGTLVYLTATAVVAAISLALLTVYGIGTLLV